MIWQDSVSVFSKLSVIKLKKRSHSHRMDQTMFFNVNYVQSGIFCRQMQTQWLRNWAYRSTIGNSYSKWIFTFNELFSYTYNDQTNTRKLCEGLCSLRLLKVGLWNDGIINKIMSKICISSLLRYLLFFICVMKHTNMDLHSTILNFTLG